VLGAREDIPDPAGSRGGTFAAVTGVTPRALDLNLRQFSGLSPEK
jgi:hypothetical protein